MKDICCSWELLVLRTGVITLYWAWMSHIPLICKTVPVLYLSFTWKILNPPPPRTWAYHWRLENILWSTRYFPIFISLNIRQTHINLGKIHQNINSGYIWAAELYLLRFYVLFNYDTLLCITFIVKNKKWKQNFKLILLASLAVLYNDNVQAVVGNIHFQLEIIEKQMLAS